MLCVYVYVWVRERRGRRGGGREGREGGEGGREGEKRGKGGREGREGGREGERGEREGEGGEREGRKGVSCMLSTYSPSWPSQDRCVLQLGTQCGCWVQ